MAKEKQSSLPEMPSPAIRNKVLRALEIKEKIGDQQQELKEALDDVRKMMKDQGKKSMQCEDESGLTVIIRLVPTGEKVVLSKAKKKDSAG